MSTITIFPETSDEYKRLSDAAEKIREATGKTVRVKNVMFDAGQNWSWTTIVVGPDNDIMSYQLLYPTEQKTIVSGTDEEIAACIEGLINRIKQKQH